MKNNKAPGLDGYCYEFFKIFWEECKLFNAKHIQGVSENTKTDRPTELRYNYMLTKTRKRP